MSTNAGVLETIGAIRIVPVIVLADADRAGPLGSALCDAGLPIAEVTLRTDAAEEAIAAMACVDGLIVGAGTVIRVQQVDRAVDAGARFIVSPGLSPAIVERGLELGVPVLPGVSTATDIMRALDLGLTTLKFFPAEAAGGRAAVAALAAPFPSVRFVPTGGIDADRAEAYLSLPSVVAVGGSWMVPADLLAAADWAGIRKLVRQAVRRIGASGTPQ